MHPAYSVIFLTTLIGVGQGLFLALFASEGYMLTHDMPLPEERFYAIGSVLSVAFLLAGLVASFFHLGRPERAWRSAAKWRTSWLSREVIALPVTIGLIALYGLIHYGRRAPNLLGTEFACRGEWTVFVGAAAAVAAIALFVCTGMIYACIKFLQEWASPLTVINYTLLGSASGFLLATAYAAYTAPELVQWFAVWTAVLTLIALITRSASLIRNARLRPKSTLQSAIGVRHRLIAQKAQGFMGGSFNTRDFFHGVRPTRLRSIKWLFVMLVFIAPMGILGVALRAGAPALIGCAFVVQYIGLVAERWFFFADANHPQNLYYQAI